MAYEQLHISWNPRGVTGMENNPEMKRVFVELECLMEEHWGRHRIADKGVAAYKGTTKKWQILDDSVYSREEV